jgi:hypothetical protein
MSRFRLVLDQDVDQQHSPGAFTLSPPQRRDQHEVGFDVPVVALDKGRGNELDTLEIDLLDQVGGSHGQQIANVLGVLQQQFHGVFPELPHHLPDLAVLHAALLFVRFVIDFYAGTPVGAHGAPAIA